MRVLIDRQAALEHVVHMDLFGKDYPVVPVAVLKKLQPAQRWIPVTERLPEEEGLYLVAGDFPPGAEVHTRYFNVLHDRSVWSGTMTDKVKWWMPIPKPPEGAQDEN